MTPVWIAITSLSVAVVGLLLTLVAHLIRHAYSMGQRDQRIHALESRPHDGDCVSQLAALTATLTSFKEDSGRRMEAVEQGINALRGSGGLHASPAPRARAVK